MINLQKEIKEYLLLRAYASLSQIQKKVKVPYGFVVDAIAAMPDVKEVGRYYNNSEETIQGCYTVRDGDNEDLRKEIEKKQMSRQITNLIAELSSEIKVAKTQMSVRAQMEYLISHELKPVAKYFLLNKMQFHYCYRVALNEITLPESASAATYFFERFLPAQLAA